MNKLLFTLLLTPIILLGEVPSLINYSGRLLNADGSPATGTVSIVVDIYDASTGGTKIYTEIVGNVTLNQGVYSFEFGATGTSTVSTTENMATGDGSTTVYNYTVANPPIIAGTVSMADGTYTWSQASGSSSPSDFLGSVSNITTGTLSAIYLSGAPAQGTYITVTYDYNQTGIAGALQRGSQHWMEISIGGNAQSPRQRLVAVPFAETAKNLDGTHAEFDADGNLELKSGGVKFPDGTIIENSLRNKSVIKLVSNWIHLNSNNTPAPQVMRIGHIANDDNTTFYHFLDLPDGTKITKLSGLLYDDSSSIYSAGIATISLQKETVDNTGQVTAQTIGSDGTSYPYTDGDYPFEIDLTLSPEVIDQQSAVYFIKVDLLDVASNGQNGNGYVSLKYAKIEYITP